MTQIGRNAPCPCGSERKYKTCCLARDEAQRKPQTGEDAVIVCMPTRGQICYETHLALCMNLRDVQICNISVGRKPVVEARNVLAKRAIAVARENPFPFVPREVFVLFIDDDAWWPPNMVSHMLAIMNQRRDVDALFARFGARKPYSRIIALRDAEDPESDPKPGVDCGHHDLAPIERAGMHFCLMRLSLLERVGDDPFTPVSDEGEDYAFCDRAVAIGARLRLALQMPALHVDSETGLAYVPGQPAILMHENNAREISPELAAELAAGTTKRSYGEHIDAIGDRLQSEAKQRMQAEMEQRRAISAP